MIFSWRIRQVTYEGGEVGRVVYLFNSRGYGLDPAYRVLFGRLEIIPSCYRKFLVKKQGKDYIQSP